jgi:hypothetical protein
MISIAFLLIEDSIQNRNIQNRPLIVTILDGGIFGCGSN